MGALSPTLGGVSIPVYEPDEDAHRKRIGEWAKEVMKGKLNDVGSVTLATGTTTTTVQDSRVGVNSFIGMMATTANAASAAALGSLFITTTDSAFTITHNNSASADKTFRYCVLG